MTLRLLLIAGAAGFGAPALAVETVCAQGNETRVVAVVYPSSPATVPCQVTYTKGGATKTLWTAANEAGYCEARAKEFVAKLENMGWRCNGSDQPRETRSSED